MSGGGLAGSIAPIIIPNEEADPERQPLIRQDTRTENRARFQQNERTAVQGVFQRSHYIVGTVIIFIALFFLVWVGFYIQGVRSWWLYKDIPCDKHLADWLLASLIMPVFTVSVECCSCKKMRYPVLFVTIVVLLVGFHNFYTSETCQKTNPDLYRFIYHYLIFLAIWWIILITVPSVFLAVLVYGMWHGWFDEINDTIKHIETIKFDRSLFAEEGVDDGKPAPECCVCFVAFDEYAEIKRTICNHYFHEECLGKWLRVSKTCPLCRQSLEKNVEPDIDDSIPVDSEEVLRLLEVFPDMDHETAMRAIRRCGSAEVAINAILERRS
jgi:hypothetical protein